MNRVLTGTLLVLFAAVCFAFLPIFTKLAYRYAIDPLDLVTWRFIVAAISIWLLRPLWWGRARMHDLARRDVLILLAMGALYGFVALTGFLALDRVPATTYSLVFYTYPALVALISFVLGERLSLTGWVAIGLALTGCALTVGGQLVIGTPLDLVFLLLNSGSYAAYLVLAGVLTRQVSGLATGVLTISGTCLVMVPLSLAMGGPAGPDRLVGWAACAGPGYCLWHNLHPDHADRCSAVGRVHRLHPEHDGAALHRHPGRCSAERTHRAGSICWRRSDHRWCAPASRPCTETGSHSRRRAWLSLPCGNPAGSGRIF